MEIIEQDTTDKEDIPNILEFILPDGILPPYSTMFGMSFNRRLFNGWVKQPSACCGAASIAGAWNGLLNLNRNDELSLNHNHVLNMYREIFVEMIDKKQSAFERKLGARINDLLETVNDQLKLIGREIGGKKGVGATRKAVLNIIKSLTAIHFQSMQKQRDEAGGTAADCKDDFAIRRNALDCFIELFESEGFAFDAADTADSAEDVVGAEEGKDSDNEVSLCLCTLLLGAKNACVRNWLII